MTKRVSVRNATFQQWQALLTNRAKRQHARQFLVQGVRPITLAVESGWPLAAVLHDSDKRLSDWALNILDTGVAATYAVAGELMHELGEKADTSPELLLLAEIPPDDLDRIPVGPHSTVVVFDRPTSPGNIGTLIRSADAFGISGVIVTGHAADIYDPQAVRASTGSLFGVPAIRAATSADVITWARGHGMQLVGTDETGGVSIKDFVASGPSLVIIGNETSGMSKAWRDECDQLLRIPMVGSASSLNASVAAGIVLYELAAR